jgi:hypothetical protein
MNTIFHLLMATMLIAGLILFRMLADRYILRTRIPGGHADRECEQSGCFHGCNRDAGVAPDHDSVARQNT